MLSCYMSSFQDQNVRRVAVQRLEQLSDVELEGYLPQLVQVRALALRPGDLHVYYLAPTAGVG